jgi:hypothetical protein
MNKMATVEDTNQRISQGKTGDGSDCTEHDGQ